ncbi:MAG: hypothetical protein VX341_14190 [Bdellovibrionota bacterium]|nr:hypothetical protein [Bdellovibrionota bacterium]
MSLLSLTGQFSSKPNEEVAKNSGTGTGTRLLLRPVAQISLLIRFKQKIRNY